MVRMHFLSGRTIRKLLAVHAASGGAFFWREMFTESLRSRVLSLYKTLYHMGKEYPKGADWFHVRLKKAFHNNRNESDPQKIEHLILRGEYVVKVAFVYWRSFTPSINVQMNEQLASFRLSRIALLRLEKN